MSEDTQAALKRHYHMFSIMVIYSEGGREKRQFMNSVSPSEQPYVNSMDLARVQQQTQVRFQQVFDPQKKAKLLDLYVQSISYMGHMTNAEFDGGFSSIVEKASAPAAPTPPEEEAEVVA